MSIISNRVSRWKALWAPNRYQGMGKKKSYFEGGETIYQGRGHHAGLEVTGEQDILMVE